MNKKRKILVVDDDPEIIILLQIGLEKYGFEVVSGKDGKEAIDLTRTHQPDLILMDVMMPDVDGFEACKAIKREQAIGFIPIIFVTAKGSLPDIVEGLKFGDDYLAKPFNIHEVIARVRSMLRIKELTEQLEHLTKAAAIVAAAVTVNHKINSPLTTITLQIDMIKTKLSETDFNKIKPHLDDITKAAKTIHKTAQQLAEIAKKPEVIKYKEYIDGIQMIDVDLGFDSDDGNR